MYTPIRLAAAGAALAGTLMFGPAAVAAPTVQLVTGETTVRLSSELLDALGSLGVTPDNVLPGGLHPTDAGASVVFPIPTGELDGAGPVLEIFHSGGLTLTAGETRVPLRSTSRTGGRATAPEGHARGDPARAAWASWRIRGANLTLTEGAADALNGAFGLDGVFTAGFPIGTARIYA